MFIHYMAIQFCIQICDVPMSYTDSGLSCAVDNGGCSHECKHTTNGTICSCPVGYRLTEDRRVCTGKRSVTKV